MWCQIHHLRHGDANLKGFWNQIKFLVIKFCHTQRCHMCNDVHKMDWIGLEGRRVKASSSYWYLTLAWCLFVTQHIKTRKVSKRASSFCWCLFGWSSAFELRQLDAKSLCAWTITKPRNLHRFFCRTLGVGGSGTICHYIPRVFM